mmetsp:Transcript_25282/g.71301  ORF Transcript_25282/g.71301 Transcript_25282/m.71301 type:complete len:278 (-) Transcript_25282:810-1643(-)
MRLRNLPARPPPRRLLRAAAPRVARRLRRRARYHLHAGPHFQGSYGPRVRPLRDARRGGGLDSRLPADGRGRRERQGLVVPVRAAAAGARRAFQGGRRRRCGGTASVHTAGPPVRGALLRGRHAGGGPGASGAGPRGRAAALGLLATPPHGHARSAAQVPRRRPRRGDHRCQRGHCGARPQEGGPGTGGGPEGGRAAVYPRAGLPRQLAGAPGPPDLLDLRGRLQRELQGHRARARGARVAQERGQHAEGRGAAAQHPGRRRRVHRGVHDYVPGPRR